MWVSRPVYHLRVGSEAVITGQTFVVMATAINTANARFRDKTTL